MLNQMCSIYFYFIQKAQLLYGYSFPDIMMKEVNCACQATQDICIHDKLYMADFYRAVFNSGSTLCLR